ncbi:MAG: hypothetical protein M3094_00515, partial [Actinomycetia bacterium]|nr:hypothetical protein [Actinomycetes bacterium]
EEGLEPSRVLPHRNLNPARLPIPPLARNPEGYMRATTTGNSQITDDMQTGESGTMMHRVAMWSRKPVLFVQSLV